MTPSFEISGPASRDLDEILDFIISDRGPERAAHVHERLLDAFRRLSEFPHIGRRIKSIEGANLRMWAVWSYLILYNPESTPLKIVRVVHGARDLTTLFEKI